MCVPVILLTARGHESANPSKKLIFLLPMNFECMLYGMSYVFRHICVQIVESDVENNINRANTHPSMAGRLKISAAAKHSGASSIHTQTNTLQTTSGKNNGQFATLASTTTHTTSGQTPTSKHMQELLRAKAAAYSRAADFRNYCETLIQLNEWETALAIAPAVSEHYWHSLCTQYAHILLTQQQTSSAQTTTQTQTQAGAAADPNKQSSQQSTFASNPERCVPFLLAADCVQETVQFYLDRRETDSALVVAKMLGGVSAHASSSGGGGVGAADTHTNTQTQSSKRSGTDTRFSTNTHTNTQTNASGGTYRSTADEFLDADGVSAMSIQLSLTDDSMSKLNNGDTIINASRHDSLTTFLDESDERQQQQENDGGDNKLLALVSNTQANRQLTARNSPPLANTQALIPHTQTHTATATATTHTTTNAQAQTHLITAYAADMYLDSSRPILAAASYIAIGDVRTGIDVLTACCQHDLAFAVASVFDCVTNTHIVALATKMAALKGGLPVALDVLNTLNSTSPNNTQSSGQSSSSTVVNTQNPRIQHSGGTTTNTHSASPSSAHTPRTLAHTDTHALLINSLSVELQKGLLISRFCEHANEARLLCAQFGVRPATAFATKGVEFDSVGDFDEAIICYLLARDYARAVNVRIIIVNFCAIHVLCFAVCFHCDADVDVDVRVNVKSFVSVFLPHLHAYVYSLLCCGNAFW
jgi:hypothetical protein